ncbi:hypothetical protein F8388_001275 [Cannabis sativa]|uniref:Uncharacterized protein n=1 Tax=Cannabis sativa TaxID=3483 RepID=A0A7J6G6J5_CANSA|nr:hypothetical protein F8388_001275 [Cannabis sativa]
MVMVLLWRFIRRNINYNDKENKTTGGRNGALGKISLSNVDTRGVDVLASSLSNTNTCRGNVVIRICILPLGSDWSIFLSDKVKFVIRVVIESSISVKAFSPLVDF